MKKRHLRESDVDQELLRDLFEALKVYEVTLGHFQRHKDLKPLLTLYKRDFGAHEAVLADIAKTFGRDTVVKTLSSLVGRVSPVKGTNPITAIANAIRGVLSVATDAVRSRSKDLQRIARDTLNRFSDLEELLYPEPARKGRDYRWPHIMDSKTNVAERMGSLLESLEDVDVSNSRRKDPTGRDAVLGPLLGKNIVFLVGDGIHDGETLFPMAYLLNRGARVHVIGEQRGLVKAYNSDVKVEVGLAVEEATIANYHLMVIPGGESPDRLRNHSRVVRFVRDFYDIGKTIAAICHGPQLLVEAGIMEGKRSTCFPDMADELRDAGAVYVDEEVVVDENLITSRDPDDLPAFCMAIEQALKS